MMATGAPHTKTALMDAARSLIAERGYAGTSVRDIAAASGANLAAVNYHFGSREALLDEAVLRSFLEWTERFQRLSTADPHASPMHRMAAAARSVMADLPDAQPLFAAFLEALLRARRSPDLQRRLASHYAEQRRRVAAVIAPASRGPIDSAPSGAGHSAHSGAGAIPQRTLEVLASLLIAFVDGLQLQALVDPRAIPTPDELAGLLAATPSPS